MMAKLNQILCQFLLIINTVNSARILGIFPMPSVSHQNSYRPLMEALAKRGHELVIATTHPAKYKQEEYPNLRQIDLHEVSYPKWTELNMAGIKESSTWGNFLIIMKGKRVVDEILDDELGLPEMQDLIKNPKHQFDLCFIAAITPAMFAFKDRFNCSLILISSQAGSISNYKAFGSPTDPTLYPPMLSPYLDDLNFWQRVHISLIYVGTMIFYRSAFVWSCDSLVRKHFGEDYRSVGEIEKSADMLFLNDHPILGGIRPTVPGIIFLYGMHIKPHKPLPVDLQKILDDAKNGVVYLSLGSNVKSAQLSQVKINAFLEAFKELPYTVLWKWENETLPGKPANVHISKWLPQQDVLAHPNIKAFITQGGQQSMEEAIHHKVPLIGMPFLGDQDLNVRKMVKFGIGTDMNLYTLSKEIIVNSIKKVVEDPSYRENISKLSNLLTDQPQTSMERAVWWTEYVLRHKGAKHLRAPGTKVPAYQYFLLDIIAFVLVCAVVAIYIIVKISCEIHKRFIRKPDKPKKS
ncbi:UDP-glucosyltransferase 2-like isoform X2 [Arctopsyche grandis]|uniref:UDP-glucosyltransferase 2-like isoform X2 n=1 Tax=Arctopsyche grandis TaxID=121162 RepID=UPI00406D98FC